MPDLSKNVVLLVQDTMVRKGLEILLTDMSFGVVAAGSISELDVSLTASNIIPDLFISLLMFENNQASIKWLRILRQRYQVELPAIFFNNEAAIMESQITDDNLLIVSDQIQPAKLRQKIAECIA